MPEFEKSTGYQMKGSKFYGKGNSSPAKQAKTSKPLSKDIIARDTGTREGVYSIQDVSKVKKDKEGTSYVTNLGDQAYSVDIGTGVEHDKTYLDLDKYGSDIDYTPDEAMSGITDTIILPPNLQNKYKHGEDLSEDDFEDNELWMENPKNIKKKKK